MTGKGRTTKPINGEKLKKILENRFLTFSEVSVECGYNESAVSRCIKAGYMSQVMIKAIELRYNIRPEDYVIPEPKTEKKEGEQMELFPENSQEFDYGHLKSVIFEAVYEAVKKAWAE